MVKCDKCGALIDENDKFCMNCGSKLNFKILDIPPLVTLEKCPVCKKEILNEWNYCRYCGYDTINPNQGTSMLKKIVDDINYSSTPLRFCTNCGKKYHDDSINCQQCGTEIPKPDGPYYGNLPYEKFQLIYINQILVPLSTYYKVNFRKILLKDHFNLSFNEETHIIYLLMEYVLNNPNNDVIPYFEEILEKTREIFKDIEGYVLNKIKPQIEEWFNTTGFIFNNEKQISSEEYQIIKTPITTNKHGGGTKALATLGFGLIGYAASSGVKTDVKTEKIKTSDAKYCFTTINISNKYVDIDIKITGENNTKIILKWENISLFSDDEYFVLDSGETFKCDLNNQKINNLISDALIDTVITSDSKLVHEYHPKVLSKVKKFLNELINEKINSFKIKESSKSTIKLEKLIEMYDKGLLSDEEFITMKKKVK